MNLGVKVEKATVAGVEVFIKTLTGGEHSAAVIELLQKVGANPGLMPELGGLLISCCLVDEQGNPQFEDPVKAREAASIGFLTEFIEAALDASGLGDDADQITKNSNAAQ